MAITESGILVPSTAEREATIRFNDTLSDAMRPVGAPPIYDFDADLTAQGRGNGYFEDAKYPIGPWPATGEYGVVLAAELRQEQKRIYAVYQDHDRTHLPDAEAIAKSLGKMLVVGVNWAVRREEHRETGQNGDPFYIAELEDNVQIISQLQFLRGVASRGLVRGLWRIRDDNPIWPKGEQHRSSIADQLRNFPEGLVFEDLNSAPKDKRTELFLAYGDKYGNGRLGKPENAPVPEIIAGKDYRIRLDGKEMPEPVVGVHSLPEIPQDALGVYINPADASHTRGIRYFEICRRVANPNDPRNSAYETLRRTVLPNSGQHPDWAQVQIELAA